MYWVQRGKRLKEIEFTISNKRYPACNDIMCFDIETSSAYIDKRVLPYMNTKKAEEYENKEKVSLCYIWQFSINENVYMGRRLEDFRSFLIELESYIDFEKIIYVHSLSFEFQFLQNIMKFEKVFAREKRKVLFAKWRSYTFRCSYFLTNMSLAVWANQKKLPVQKLIGNLDYSILRTPKTKLTEEEIEYCVNDVLVMYYGLLEYKEQYGNVKDIPLTQTGEVRKEVIKLMSKENKYRNKCISLIPKTLTEYKSLVEVFQGGYTHANYIYSGRVIDDVHSKDISSSYPYAMVVEKYPITPFMKCRYDKKYRNKDKYSFIIYFRCINVRSRLYNSFLSKSRCKVTNCKVDNGRIIACESLEVKLTNIDFELFDRCYSYEDFEVIEFKLAMNDYLSPVFVKYVLELYGRKTTLKGVEGMEALYMKSKQYVNSLFGMAVTKDITDEIIYNNGTWGTNLLNEEVFKDRTEHIKKNKRKVFTAFQFGVWVTAYARRNLWNAIIAIDDDVIYCDTDSVKYIGNHEDYFNRYNKEVEEKERKIAKRLNLPESVFNPADKYGNTHRLGIFDDEGTYKQFKTLGAKKYIYVNQKDEMKMTVSGVRKSAVSQLKSIDEFTNDFEFDIEHANKLISHYNDNQSNCIWNYGREDEYRSSYKYGISMQPTTYKLGISLDYYLLMLENMRKETKIFSEQSEIL